MSNFQELLQLELSVLGSKCKLDLQSLQDDLSTIYNIVTSLLDHHYEHALAECLKVEDFFQSINFLNNEFVDLHIGIHDNGNNNKERKLYLFCCGISCLQLFVQVNWTGPSMTAPLGVKDSEITETKARKLLSKDNQPVYHLVKVPHYLYAAKCIFSKLCKEQDFQTAHWWLFRCHCIHGLILLEKSQSLFDEASSVMSSALSKKFLNDIENSSFLFQIRIESGLFLLHYYQYKQADEQFEAARKLTGLEFGFTGALGVRTKFQQKPVSQLLVEVKRTSENALKSVITITSSEHLPVNLSLNDDTLLNHIKLVDENELTQVDLCPEECCMILAACTAMQKTNPAHRIKQEKLQAIIEFLLNAPSCWAIHAEALRLRCINEKDKSRTVERSMTQMDSLVSKATSVSAISPNRLDLIYAVHPPPIWNLQKDLAKLYISLGAISSALTIYERLEMWEDAILCLIRTDRAGDAMKMIKSRLEVEETPNLWCLLGDIMQEPKHYEKAWDLSKEKSARAMTSLGCYYISKKEFEKAVGCFEKSLSLLSLQVNTWFTMGCALLSLEEFSRSAQAFRRCVSLDWDNYEAWTNLSASYVRCGKKEQAFKALSEAIKCNFDRWQLWENYIAVATDVGQFNEAISSYNRLLELKKKFIDVPILNVLVRAVVEDIPDCNGNPGSSLKGKLLTLFGHVTTQVTGDSRIWVLYARLCGDGIGDVANENEKAIQHLHKALRCGLQKAGWEKDNDFTEKLIEVCEKLSSGCAHNRENLPTPTLSSIRLSINGFAAKLKQRLKSILDEGVQDKMKSYIDQVTGLSEQLTSMLSKNKT